MAITHTFNRTISGQTRIIFFSTNRKYIRNKTTGKIYTKVSEKFPSLNLYEETDIDIPVKKTNNKESNTETQNI